MNSNLFCVPDINRFKAEHTHYVDQGSETFKIIFMECFSLYFLMERPLGSIFSFYREDEQEKSKDERNPAIKIEAGNEF